VPELEEKWGSSVTAELVSINPRKDTVAIAGRQFVFTYIGQIDGMAYLNHFRGPIRVFDLMTGRGLRQYFSAEDSFRTIATSPDGRWLALGAPSGREDGRGIVLIDVERDSTVSPPDAVSLKPSDIEPMTFSRCRAAAVYSFGRGDGTSIPGG
jgi:hypothetical protein